MDPNVLNLSTFGEIIRKPSEEVYDPSGSTEIEEPKGVEETPDKEDGNSEIENDPNLGSIVHCALDFSSRVKLFHWQTTSYEEHKTLNNFYKDFSKLTDTLIETIFGKFGRQELSTEECSVSLKNYKESDDKAVASLLSEMESCYFNECRKKFSTEKDPEIINIIDEIIALIQKNKYLISLR